MSIQITEPKGVRYNKTQTEYQLFPEEYFSAADCTIYFGDTWIDDLTAIQIELTEKILPVYGYASKTFDYTLRGQRIVQGAFRIAFREAGYLFTVLDHIGQLSNAQPAEAFLLQGKEVPQWHGHVKQRIETLLEVWHGNANSSATKRLSPRFRAPLRYGMNTNDVRHLQQALTEQGFYSGDLNGLFDAATEEAVKNYQNHMGYTSTGVVDKQMEEDFSVSETVVSPISNPLANDPNGLAEPRMVQYEKEIWGRSFIKDGESVRKHESFFYRGRQSDNNGVHTQKLYQKGIDIHINFGPLPEFLQSKLYKSTSALSFNTTVRALRNVQIYSLGVMIDAKTGEAVEEVYNFIAKDLD